MSVVAEVQKKLQEIESLRRKAIEELLGKRAEIDSQLKQLGYRRGRRGRPKGSITRKKR